MYVLHTSCMLCVDLYSGRRVGWVGGVDNYGFDSFEAVCHLAMGNHDLIKKPLIKYAITKTSYSS
jgi:hypothetical protein